MLQHLDDILPQVTKPARYTGGELNSVSKDIGQVAVRFAFCFPDVYEVGMSHLGTRILYHVLNSREDVFCERIFAPWTDMEEKMREHNIPLFSLETKTPARDFDIVGFTIQYEMSLSNVLNMLDLANIPLYSAQRDEKHPLVIAGGPCTYNAEPLADFMDIVTLGEGEEQILELVDAYKLWQQKGYSKQEFLIKIAGMEGYYVPSLYEVSYHDDGRVSSVQPKQSGIPSVIHKRVIQDFDKVQWPDKPIVPFLEIVHDRITLEIFRGCTRGCRFCQAGMIYRPVREKTVDTLVCQALKGMDSSGYDEISLSSLSTGDYSQLPQLIENLMKETAECHTTLSLPSLRIDAYAKDYMDTSSQRKAGLTLAPEAGTQRLRDVINKNVTAEDLRRSVHDAFEAGWDRVKLYFMIGLPTETYEDLDGIVDLARMVVDEYYQMPREKRRRKVQVTVSTSTFVPKPYTPFQWATQDSVEEMLNKQKYLREKFHQMKSVTYNWHDSGTSRLEAAFARGDRRIGKALYRAWELGCRFDGWKELFSYDKWLQAFQDTGLDIDFYAARARDEEETLPWDHTSCGVSKSFLLREWHNALEGKVTPDCRNGCGNCGMMDICGSLQKL